MSKRSVVSLGARRRRGDLRPSGRVLRRHAGRDRRPGRGRTAGAAARRHPRHRRHDRRRQPKAGESGYTSGSLKVEDLIKAVPGIEKLRDSSGEQIANIGSQDMNDEVWLKLAQAHERAARATRTSTAS